MTAYTLKTKNQPIYADSLAFLINSSATYNFEDAIGVIFTYELSLLAKYGVASNVSKKH